eukprot:CAMPEP_0202872344 /NCGR_PEP_ID=MMETSP1391-20130828/20986_1 /ASSEMBLY_ACC=CAM_ASM_000867 /TAXON_ID=1034604 /ORGANISM="Chlamydomonas leiostraca, Strain SAG 11-49" /LENGTH=115 /DNA_ID=CAMNT_0049553363 /DNA_START=112 /DNA_END=459 /DNA_ORIENTATION=+
MAWGHIPRQGDVGTGQRNILDAQVNAWTNRHWPGAYQRGPSARHAQHSQQLLCSASYQCHLGLPPRIKYSKGCQTCRAHAWGVVDLACAARGMVQGGCCGLSVYGQENGARWWDT